MKTIESILIGLILVFGFGCGFGSYEKTLESKVVVRDKEYKIFYVVEREEGDIEWEGKRSGVVRYKIRDEATKNSKFYLYIEKNIYYNYSSAIFKVVPMHFDEIDNQSFLQKIILENDRYRGQEIFEDIFNQLEFKR